MEYVMLSDRFGGLNTYLSPDSLGPGGAQEMFGCDVSTGALEGVFAKELVGNPVYIPKTIYPFTNKASAERYATARFNGILYRASIGGKFDDKAHLQFSQDDEIFDILTMRPPVAPTLSSVSGSGSVPIGTYKYVITYKNYLGHESAPSAELSVTVSSNNSTVNLTVPTFNSTGSVTGGSDTVTSVSNSQLLRVGTRLNASNIPGIDTYVTEVLSGSSFKMSAPATGSGTSTVNIKDFQISKINVYRLDVDVTTAYLFVGSINFGSSPFADNKAVTSLAGVLNTIGCGSLDEVSNISINPAGTICGVIGADKKTVFYFSLVNILGGNPGLYKPAQIIQAQDKINCSIYALDRFMFFTTSRNFCVFIEDAATSIPVLKYIENPTPCVLSANVYAAEYENRVYWNTSNGICSTDGQSSDIVTKYVFKKEENEAFVNCYGMTRFNDALYFYLPKPTPISGTPDRILYKLTKQFGWSRVLTIPGGNGAQDGNVSIWGTATATVAYVAVAHGPIPGGSDNFLYWIEKGPNRENTGVYWTGEWTGEKHSALKKFRKISALFTGAIEIEVYVDGVALPGKLTANNGTASKRISWWLPSGTKGRAISLRVKRLAAAYSIIEELGVWVGEQRGEMP